MSSEVEIACPSCEKKLKAPAAVLGKRIKCKSCEHIFVAEERSAEKAKPAAKPTKPGATAKPKPPPEEPKPAPAPYKFVEEEEDDSATPNPFGVIDEGMDVPRCPHCAQELDPPDAIVCIHCGFNNMTRTKAESKKVWAPTTEDYLMHLGPGILALLVCIGLITFCIISFINMNDWLADTFLEAEKKEDKVVFYARANDALVMFIIAACVLPVVRLGYFAIKRLCIEYQPMEQVKK